MSGDAPGSFGFGIGLNIWTDGSPGSALGVENVGYDFTNDGAAFIAGTEYFVAATINTTTAQVYVNAVHERVPSFLYRPFSASLAERSRGERAC